MKIEVVEYSTDEVVHTIECSASRTRAEKAEDGININLNHDEYFTRIVDNT